MKIVTARRISQVFFFALLLWFCVVATVGEKFWQIRGWPVNWLLQLDPLVAVGTILTTGALYGPLLWALATVVLTILLGRFFCGWVCPFGSLHQFVSWLAHRRKATAEKIKLNRYRKAQNVKYVILVVFLGMAAFPSLAATLQIGLLDPIPLITRSVNLVLLPLLDRVAAVSSPTSRFYEQAGLLWTVLAAAVLLNLVIPRFYCRFICPLGALFGLLSRFAIWRIGKSDRPCTDCGLCQRSCEGACSPAGKIRISECVLCFNCRQQCPHEVISYQGRVSAAGEITSPDLSRRGFLLSLAGGALTVPAVRLSNTVGANYDPGLIRPPGALPEEEFLKRCIKCGQCIRICPTNVIQPGGIDTGLESLWTPVLNNRVGTSGCQLNCVACGQVCPTAAIRPITLDEKLGRGKFADSGPVRLGSAFVDRSRCLPWSAGKPCIVCEENCPLSPKAIFTREHFETIRDGVLTIKDVSGKIITTVENNLSPGRLATGDYYCLDKQGSRIEITANQSDTIELAEPRDFSVGDKIEVQVRLQRPYVDIEKCIGCGVCEHECPVSGTRAIRVRPEGETRNADKRLWL